MHRKDQLSPTHEMYLKVLYGLGQQHDVARVRDMGKGLGVNPGTVSTVLKKLEQAALVRHDRYGIVALTSSGTALAECVIRRFETIKALLTEVLNLDPKSAEDTVAVLPTTVAGQLNVNTGDDSDLLAVRDSTIQGRSAINSALRSR